MDILLICEDLNSSVSSSPKQAAEDLELRGHNVDLFYYADWSTLVAATVESAYDLVWVYDCPYLHQLGLTEVKSFATFLSGLALPIFFQPHLNVSEGDPSEHFLVEVYKIFGILPSSFNEGLKTNLGIGRAMASGGVYDSGSGRLTGAEWKNQTPVTSAVAQNDFLVNSVDITNSISPFAVGFGVIFRESGVSPTFLDAYAAYGTDLSTTLTKGYCLLGYEAGEAKADAGTFSHNFIAFSYVVGTSTFTSSGLDFLEECFQWLTGISASYIGYGGLQFSGSADTSIEGTFPYGGLKFSGTGTYSFTRIGGELVDYTATDGGIQLAGSAGNFFSAGSEFGTDPLFTQTDNPQEFLFHRLEVQGNPTGSVDSGPIELGDIYYGIGYQRYDLTYDSTSGQVTIKNTVTTEVTDLFVQLGIAKLDFTFDDRGYPSVVYEINEEVWIFEWSHALQTYVQRKLSDGTQPFICFYGIRENSVGQIYVLYYHQNQLVYRLSSETYSSPYATSLEVPTDLNVKIEGMGQTAQNKLQFNVRVTYERT